MKIKETLRVKREVSKLILIKMSEINDIFKECRMSVVIKVVVFIMDWVTSCEQTC